MTRIIGPTGSRRRRRFLLLPLLCTAALALFWVAGAQAVHDINVFELDKNATTTGATTEDWDLICKANLTTLDPPPHDKCLKASGYTLPSGTTKSDPNAFENDPSESQQDDILKGGTKDDNDTSSWKWASAKPSPPKNDITHSFAAEYTCNSTATPPPTNNVTGCTGTPDDKLLYFGGDRFSNSGSANLAFWFFQKRVRQLTANGKPLGDPTNTETSCTDSSGCSFQGVHTAGKVPHDPAHPGDILIISAFGPKAQIQVFEWVGVGNAPKDQCVSNACSLVRLLPASLGQACEDVSDDPACGTVNDTGGTNSPWKLSQKNAPSDKFDATNFFEGGVNLTSLGLAQACFSSFLMNTRASASVDAELHDKVLGQFGRCAPGLSTLASQNGEVNPGVPVTDRATIQVTGAAAPDDATGKITFYLCTEATRTTCTNQIGDPVDLTNAQCDPASTSDTDGKSCALSLTVNDSSQTGNRGTLDPGKYCFRAKAVLDNYDNPDEFTNTTTECFTVAKIPTDIRTNQSWYPNDTARIASTKTGDSILAGGTVDFFLVNNATCDLGTSNANLKYAERITIASGDLSGTPAVATVTTHNPGGGTGVARPPGFGTWASFNITTLLTDPADSTFTGGFSWKVVYTPASTDTSHLGRQSACTAAVGTTPASIEKFNITYTNDNSGGTALP